MVTLIDPTIQLAFAIAENKGVFALLLGSGISRAAGIPTGWEITVDLIRRLAAATAVTEQKDWGKWYYDTFGDQPSYSNILERITASADERRAILASYIEPTADDRERKKKVPTDAHNAIADLVASGHFKVLITTNFDRLLENALREKGVEPTVISSVDTLAGAEPLTHSKCYLIKLHGDYKDYRILNTDRELRTYPDEFNHLLDRVFDDHGLVVCGWSSEWDLALRNALLRSPNRRYATFWASRSNLSSAAAELAAHRKAITLQIENANNFFLRIRDLVDVLERTRVENPLGVKLAVESAKRFLAKPEYRIEFDDLLAREGNRLVSCVINETAAHQPTPDAKTLTEKVAIYEAASETLARIAGVVGRWGDQSHAEPVKDVIRSLWFRASEPLGGYVIWTNLRLYPAVLIFAAYGLAMVRRDDLAALHEFLTHRLVTASGTMRAVEVVGPGSWKGGTDDSWHFLEGMGSRVTPFSEHLSSTFTNWSSDFFGVSSDFELVFDRFEMLASLAFFESNDIELLREQKKTQPHRQFEFCPIGRFVWHSNNNVLVSQLRETTIRSNLLAAGFARGSEELLDLYLENLAFARRRVRFG